MSSSIEAFKTSFKRRLASENEFSLLEFLERCKTDQTSFATAAERMLIAVGEPQVIDTSADPRLSKIFDNKKIRLYPAFNDFFGAEEALERVMSYFRHHAQGLEESKQILYLKGPVGGGKSSIVERLKDLMQNQPIFVLKDPNEKDAELALSPVFEHPLSLFNALEHGDMLEQEYGVPRRYLNTVPSGWALEKLREFDGDFTKFNVVRIFPDKNRQVGIMKVEPGDENNQDVSVLVGKVDLRKVDRYQTNHPYSYSFSGGLNRTTQGLLDFAEMFKANIKTLHPLLTATQEHNYNGTESIPSMPYQGLIVAHSNESEWHKFRNNKDNEAFIDRICIVDVPYCLRQDEETKIYLKMVANSSLAKAPCAPSTMDMLAQFLVLTHLHEPENSTIYAKLKVYNGENVKDTMPNAKPIDEYRQEAWNARSNEGMWGLSPRFAFKVLSATFNLRPEEVQANPVDLMFVLDEQLKKESLSKDLYERYTTFIKNWIQPKYLEFIEKELRIAYIESYSEYGQTMFERYILFAEAWLGDEQARDPETHTLLNRDLLNQKLEEIEKPAGIVSAKDFRSDIVHYVLRFKASHAGNAPRWSDYEKMKNVIEKKMFSITQDILPIISFGPKSSEDEQKKHTNFVERMRTKGYTDRQIKLLVDWYINNSKNK